MRDFFPQHDLLAGQRHVKLSWSESVPGHQLVRGRSKPRFQRTTDTTMTAATDRQPTSNKCIFFNQNKWVAGSGSIYFLIAVKFVAFEYTYIYKVM